MELAKETGAAAHGRARSMCRAPNGSFGFWSKKKKHPSWGSKKLFVRLRRKFFGEQIPSRATISRILKKAGLVTAQRRTRQKVGPEHLDSARLVPVWCNDVWGVNLKGWFYTGDGHKCYPLTISDIYSRYIICCDDLASMALPSCLEEL